MFEWRYWGVPHHDVERNSVETTVQPNFSTPMLVIKDGELVVAQKV